MIAKDHIFREYDIRGVVGKDFDTSFAEALGLAFAQKTMAEFEKLGSASSPTVAIGVDCRLSGPELSKALMKGLRNGGVNVLFCGMGPTPQLYFMAVSRELHGGIQVTGSHNPGDQNGFKMMLGKRTLSGSDIQELKSLVRTDLPLAKARGTLEEIDARSLYTEELTTRSKNHMGSRKLKLVVDAGNGVGGLVGPELLRNLGCEVIELYTEPDGRFPNHHPDPTVLENIAELRKRVVQEGADAGIAWDGDADRIGVVDEKGAPIYGDMLLLIYGRQLLKELDSPTVIGDVKCSELLFSDLKKRGANAVIAKTGHSLIKAKLKELNAELAGEMSGHMFFSHRYFGFDDALHAAARFVEILSHTEIPVSEFLSDLPRVVSTPEIRVDCDEEKKFPLVEQAKKAFSEYETNTLDGVRVTFPKGWGLVRASNTQSVLVMRFEAENENLLAEYQNIVTSRIQKLQEQL